MVARWTTDQRVKDRSCTLGIIHTNIHLISQGSSQPSIAFTVQDCGLKHHSFISFTKIPYDFVHDPLPNLKLLLTRKRSNPTPLNYRLHSPLDTLTIRGST